MGLAGESDATDYGEEAPAAAAAAAAQVGGGRTLATLIRIIAPWRRKFAIVVASGISRVAAFIAVGILGALAVAAVKTGAPFSYLLILLALAAPLAGLLHWLESWLAHEIAYRLLAEMRVDLYKKLDALAPAYLVRRRSWRPDRAGEPGHRDDRVFLCPHRRAGANRGAGSGDRADRAGDRRLADRPRAAAVRLVRRARPGGRCGGGLTELGAEARDALGLLSAYVTETIPGHLRLLVAFQ